MFELTNISKSFKDGEKNKVIFKDCSFTFPDKGMIFIVGKSGCGKSTLLNLLAGFDTPDEGKISFFHYFLQKRNFRLKSFFSSIHFYKCKKEKRNANQGGNNSNRNF